MIRGYKRWWMRSCAMAGGSEGAEVLTHTNGRVNGQLTAAPVGATWRLHDCAAAGCAAAQVGACA